MLSVFNMKFLNTKTKFSFWSYSATNLLVLQCQIKTQKKPQKFLVLQCHWTVVLQCQIKTQNKETSLVLQCHWTVVLQCQIKTQNKETSLVLQCHWTVVLQCQITFTITNSNNIYNNNNIYNQSSHTVYVLSVRVSFWAAYGYPPNLQESLGVDGFWGICR